MYAIRSYYAESPLQRQELALQLETRERVERAERFRLKYRTPCIKNAYLDAQEKLQTAGLNLESYNFSESYNFV